MPDHVHAPLSFSPDKRMSRVMGDWKRFNCRRLGISWQNNYFDHRIRNGRALQEKALYIRNNPVRHGLCIRSEDWQWVVTGPVAK